MSHPATPSPPNPSRLHLTPPPTTPSLYKQNSWSHDNYRDEAWLRRKVLQNRRSKSVTEEDLDELKACIELGFGFDSSEMDKRLSDTLPAYGLYYSVSKNYNDTVSNPPPLSPPSTSIVSDRDTPSPLGSPPTIFDPEDNPQAVKTRLRQWAQVVACTVFAFKRRQLCNVDNGSFSAIPPFRSRQTPPLPPSSLAVPPKRHHRPTTSSYNHNTTSTTTTLSKAKGNVTINLPRRRISLSMKKIIDLRVYDNFYLSGWYRGHDDVCPLLVSKSDNKWGRSVVDLMNVIEEPLEKYQIAYICIDALKGDEPLIEPEIIYGIVKALQTAQNAVFSTAVISLKFEDAFDPNHLNVWWTIVDMQFIFHKLRRRRISSSMKKIIDLRVDDNFYLCGRYRGHGDVCPLLVSKSDNKWGRSVVDLMNVIEEPLEEYQIAYICREALKIAECHRGFGADVIMTSESCRNGIEHCNEAHQKLGTIKALQTAQNAVFSTAVISLKFEDAFDPNHLNVWWTIVDMQFIFHKD
ncbi:unnamed protein product [Fraxinus pennsylvanica]|uniref:Uncharacterized protein n=1 Tax=Fraxinus pennsylvanica TaxID=56036 RepID=A0AAD2DNN4_9LAMI|nr:unnamed protein product [Fraxinus pennsylvanica]